MVGVAVGLAMLIGARPGPVARVHAQTGPVTLTVTLSDQAITQGETLIARVQVTNPGGGPPADFYFAIVLPDGATVVSAGPGLGARFGRFSDLRTLVPVAAGISLGYPFTYNNDAFFTYTFTGTEPVGTYRVYFAALAAGALRDGAIGGAELLALATTEFTVGSGIVTRIDPSRTVAATIPATGGALTTSRADGTSYTMTFPSGAVSRPTAVSLAPLTGADNLPGEGRFAFGVRAEPSGLAFQAPVELTITLPDSITPNPAGYSALLVSDGGRDITPVPVLGEGRRFTVPVPHFSEVVLTDSTFSGCFLNALTAEGRAACGALARAFVDAGGVINEAYREATASILRTWFTTGIRLRIDQQGNPTLPGREDHLDLLLLEWSAWREMYQLAYGPMLVSIPQRPLADILQEAFLSLAAAVDAGIERANDRCLANKPSVEEFVTRASELVRLYWPLAFEQAYPHEQTFCLDIFINAAPPPVLTPGTPALMPVTVRARFTDGVELPNVPALVTATATGATVTPAGGAVTLPLNGNLTLTPSGVSTLVTIAAELVELPLSHIGRRSQSFTGGQAGTGQWTILNRQVIASGELVAIVDLGPGRQQSAEGPERAEVANTLISRSGVTASFTNVRASMTTSPTSSAQLIVDLVGGGRSAASGLRQTRGDAVTSSSLTFRTTGVFRCSLQVTATRSANTTLSQSSTTVAVSGPRLLTTNGQTGTVGPFDCPPGQYILSAGTSAGVALRVDGDSSSASAEFTARMLFEPITAATEADEPGRRQQ
jgi:hypothetical protein